MSQTIQIAYDSRTVTKDLELHHLIGVVNDDVLNRSQMVPAEDPWEMLDALTSGDVDMAIVANDCRGQNALAKYPDPDLRIAGEVAVPVKHALYAPQEESLGKITYVFIPYEVENMHQAKECNNALFRLVEQEIAVHFCHYFLSAWNKLHESAEKDGKALVVPEHALKLIVGEHKLADLKVDIAKLYYLVGKQETAKHVHLPYDEKTGRFDGSKCITVFTVKKPGHHVVNKTLQQFNNFNERRGHWEEKHIQDVLSDLKCDARPKVLGSFKASAYRLRAGL